MDFINEKIQQYAEGHTSPEPAVLKELNQQTHENFELPQMLSGHLQGRFLSMVSRMVRPEHVLDIGTYTGYSAICFAEGLQEGGLVHTIDINEDLKEMAEAYFEKAGVKEKVKFYAGNAREIIPTLGVAFDLVFIDADKSYYPDYFDMVIDKVNSGGWIIADNVLWSGRVLDEDKEMRTQRLDEYNKKVLKDDRVRNILVPIRDGLNIAQKVK